MISVKAIWGKTNTIVYTLNGKKSSKKVELGLVFIGGTLSYATCPRR